MTHGRRTSDRRRRVLYSTHQADNSTMTAATRREAERLREARRPTAAYGMRVQRRLQGRWFSLVPVKRTTLISIAAGLIGCSLLLCLLHYAAVAWPWIAYRPEIARPLRLDRPDSFGRWYACLLLLGSAGAALLIYQLRRYRIDDYQGRYRLWRLILIVMLLASVNALVALIPWGGAVLDAAFGKRVALAGADWIRLVVTIGAIMVALRLGAEMRRSRWALVTLVIACGLLAIPEAAKWKFMAVDSVSTWTLVTTAPLLGFTTLFLSLGGYLRMLYREVQEIEDGESLVQRLGQVRLRIFQRDEFQRDGEDEESGDPTDGEQASGSKPASKTQRERPQRVDEGEENLQSTQRRSWLPWRRAKTTRRAKPTRQGRTVGRGRRADDVRRPEETRQQEKANEPAGDPPSESKTPPSKPLRKEKGKPPTSGRRWFGLRRAKSDAAAAADSKRNDSTDDKTNETSKRGAGEPPQPSANQKKRRRFSLRLDPAARAERAQKAAAAKRDQTDSDTESNEPERSDKSKKSSSARRGLMRFWRGKDADPDQKKQSGKTNSSQPPKSDAKPDPEDDLDPDEIDWSSMSKSERRRLRKKLRRQGKAA